MHGNRQSGYKFDLLQKSSVSNPENNPSRVTKTVFQPRATAPKISVCSESPHIIILSLSTLSKVFSNKS